MSAYNVTPIKGEPGQFTTVEFRNIERPPMDPETAIHSMHALFTAIKELLASSKECGEAQALALIGEHLADQLTDRLRTAGG
jgi:hypothetical protein